MDLCGRDVICQARGNHPESFAVAKVELSVRVPHNYGSNQNPKIASKGTLWSVCVCVEDTDALSGRYLLFLPCEIQHAQSGCFLCHKITITV